jgi:hypothetical protein
LASRRPGRIKVVFEIACMTPIRQTSSAESSGAAGTIHIETTCIIMN